MVSGLLERDVIAVQRAAPLAEQVYGHLRSILRSHAFEPGDRLVDSALAKRLNVSRTPVREALMRLAADGLVETQGGGFIVPRLTLADVRDVFEIRRLLEPAAAAKVADALDKQGRRELAEAMLAADGAIAADDASAFAAANIAFRAAWVSRIPNQRMRQTLLRFDDQVSMVRRLTLADPVSRAAAHDGLQRLAPAFQANDGVAVAMTAFVDAALAACVRLLAAEE